MAIIHRVEQGSLWWHRVRLGIPTASQFHRIITPKQAELSKQARPYLYRLVAERLLGEAFEDNLERVEWIERGSISEPTARRALQKFLGVEILPGAFITDDRGRWGCSPDGLLNGKRECCEIKCPKPETQVARLLHLSDPAAYPFDEKYMPQVMGQLFISELDRAHFWSWHERMPSFYLPTPRNDEYIDKLELALVMFTEELDEATNHARRMGGFLPPSAVQTAR
jgi:hypothetical protein